jgi:hypothetical protein
MIRGLAAIGIGACLSLAGSAAVRANHAPSAVSLALLYDLTMAPVSVDVESDPRLKLVLSVASESLANQDTVRVGFITGNVSWSRTFGVQDRSILYPEVVSHFSVPVAARWRWPALCDGLYDAVTAVAHDEGRRAVVVITTGHSAGNIHSFADLVAHAREADVSLSAVLAPWPGTGRGRTSPEQYLTYWSHFPVSPHALLTRITTATGGTYIAPGPHVSGDLKRRLENALAAIRQKD